MGQEQSGLQWAAFADEAQDLAGDIATLIDRFRFALLGTIRRDGTPRISPVETHLVGEDLMLVMIPRTRKASDVRRDNRVTLQSPIINAGTPGEEYKLRGQALVAVSDHERETAANVVEIYSGWRPRATWLFVAILLWEATHISWSEDGTAVMKRWSLTEGVETRNLALDMEFGDYRSD